MQTTSQPYRALLASGAPLQARATIGGVAYTDISAPVITRATMQDRLSVGNVVSASLALAVRGAVNIPRSAAVVVEVRLNDGQTASEWLPQGTFYISRRMRDPVTGLLALECYDALLKANAVWTPSAGTWPRTMAAVTAELAALLGVTLDSRTVIPTGAAYAMSEPAEGTTIRDALGVVAQAAGGNWVMTPAGLLRLVRVGESGDTVDVTGVVGGIDVGQAGTVTGVRSTVDGVVTLIGDDTGIVVDVSIAPMIAAEMAEGLIGQAYAPFHLSGAIYDPAAELGDGVRAGAGGEVISALCSEQAAYGPAFRGDIAAPDPGEVTDEYPYIGSAERTLALAKAAAIEAVDRLDDELTQQEIFNRLTDDGAAQGLLLYNGQLYINASYINAGYLSADHIQGGTLTLGGQGNQNGVLQVLDASGSEIGLWNKDGVNISKGSIFLTFDANGSYVALGAAAGNPLTSTYYFEGKEYRTYIYGNNIVETDGDNSTFLTADALAIYRHNVNGISPHIQCIDEVDGKSSSIGPDYVMTGNLYVRNPVSIDNGGTGATTPAGARANLEITPANIGAKAVQSAVSDPTASGTAVAFIDGISQNAQGVISPTKKTVQSASQSAAGLMSAADKKKLDGIAPGATANVGTVTSVATGTGLKGGPITGSGTISTNVPRVAKDSKSLPGANTWILEEYTGGSNYNLPSNHWYYIFSMQGSDASYGAQLALGMTTSGAYYREYNGRTWGAWKSLIDTNAVTSVNNQTGAVSITPANIGAVALNGSTKMTGMLTIQPAGSEGGQILLAAPSDHPERAGINIDQQSTSNLRIFGQPSADGTSITGTGTALNINPYAKTITGGYTFTGNVTGNCSGSSGSCTGNAANVTGTVQVGHGGTGATTAAGARTNLGTSLYISSNTSATVYNQLNALNTSEAISAMLTETAAKYLSGNKVTHAVDGVIRKASAISYVFAMFDGYGYAYRWQATVTASGATVGNCYRFTGTQI